MTTINVLSLGRLRPNEVERITAIDDRLKVVDAGGRFNSEIRASWPAVTARRYLPDAANDSRDDTRAERDKLLAAAEIIIGGFPFPLDLRQRSPKLKWFHQRPAGASNLHPGDLWGSDVTVTTSRGYGETRAIAEYVIGGLLYFAKAFDHAAADATVRRFNHSIYRPLRLADKTLLVIGAGGIGRDVATLATALGMRVLGIRRRAAEPTPPFERIAPPDALYELLNDSDFVAVCCQWTPETTHLLDAKAFAAMRPGAAVINVARGEIIDETALLDALDAGRLRGALLDVYNGEFEREPPKRLWAHPNVLITPHTSGLTDRSQHRWLDVFCDNLRRYLDGQPLRNRVDWERGY